MIPGCWHVGVFMSLTTREYLWQVSEQLEHLSFNSLPLEGTSFVNLQGFQNLEGLFVQTESDPFQCTPFWRSILRKPSRFPKPWRITL